MIFQLADSKFSDKKYIEENYDIGEMFDWYVLIAKKNYIESKVRENIEKKHK